MKDAQTQKIVLSKAKNLKHADTEISRNIYIVSDKTPRERERYRELQKELKERKDKGETDLMIRDMKVVKRREGRQKGKRYETEARKMKQVQQDLHREGVIPMCLSPLTGRNNSKKRQQAKCT